jgi:RNA polymerase sigma-70 factor (ECF subfamily)
MTNRHQRIEPYMKRLYGYAYSLTRDADRAKDLTHDCAVRAITAAKVPVDEPAYRSWLFRILRNQFIDGLRRDQRTAYIFESEPPASGEMEYWGGDERLVDRLNVRLAFQKLDTRQREILALVDVAGLSYRETAEVLNVPSGTVMSRVSRARGKLLALIEDSNVRPLPQGKDRAGESRNPVSWRRNRK